jgi:hypothetical protein
MTMTLVIFLQVLALVLLLLESIGPIPANKYIRLGWAGMFFWLLSELVR